MGRLDYGCIARNIMQGIAGKTAIGIKLEYVFRPYLEMPYFRETFLI